MEADDGEVYSHLVIGFKQGSGDRVEVPYGFGPFSSKSTMLSKTAAGSYQDDLRLVKTELNARALATQKMEQRTADGPGTSLVVVAKITHVMKRDVPSDSVRDLEEIVCPNKRAKYLVSFSEEVSPPNGSGDTVPCRAMPLIGTGAFDWVLPPSGVTSSVVAASTLGEAENVAKEVKKKKPDWQAVITKVTGRLAGKPKWGLAPV